MWKDYLPQIVTFSLFLLGLLAWQQQLSDKRRFEVAEQVLVTFNRIAYAIRQVRQRHRWWHLVDMPDPVPSHYEQEKCYRLARYSIPEETLKALDTEMANLRPTHVLAKMYLRPDIATNLLVLERTVAKVKDAAERLPRIDPRAALEPKIDPEDFEPLEPDYPQDPDEYPFNQEQQEKVGADLMRIRFENRDPETEEARPGDSTLMAIESARLALEASCARYQTSPSLLGFMGRFILSLIGLPRR